MPAKPRSSDDKATADLLTKTFAGTWTRLDASDDTKPLDGILWAQTKPNADQRHILTGLLILGEGLTAEGLRRIPVSAIEESFAEQAAGTEKQRDTELGKLPPLERGDLSAADFSRLVAEHYKVWARFTSKPVAGMAKAWAVKSPTLHSWIHEARLRGLLPKAERGKRARG